MTRFCYHVKRQALSIQYVEHDEDQKLVDRIPINIIAMKKRAEIPKMSIYCLCEDGYFGPILLKKNVATNYCCSSGLHVISYEDFAKK